MRERIVAMGGPGTGKSQAILHLAKAFERDIRWKTVAKKAGLPDDHIMVCVIDPDDGLSPLVEEAGGWSAYPNLRPFRLIGEHPISSVFEVIYGKGIISGNSRLNLLKKKYVKNGIQLPVPFKEVFSLGMEEAGLAAWFDAQKDAIASTYQLNPTDPDLNLPHWVVIEMLGEWWDLVQEEYAAYEHGTRQLGLHLLQKRAEDKASGKERSVGGFEGGREWNYIKRLYRDIVYYLTQRCPTNAYSTSDVSDLPVDSQGRPVWKGTSDILLKFGVRPRGDKMILHKANHLLFFRHPGKLFEFEVVKYRGKEPDLDKVDWTKKNFWDVFVDWADRPEKYIPGWPKGVS